MITIIVGEVGHEDYDFVDDHTLSGCYADAPNDKSEVPPGDNDPYNFDGLNVCDKNGDCNNEKYDCATDLGNGKYCTTGMCPGDDDKTCSVNQKYVGCDNHNKKGDGGNHKSSDNDNHNDPKKDFKVRVDLDGKSSDTYRLRVTVYGTHTTIN